MFVLRSASPVFSKTIAGGKACRAVSGTAPSFFDLIQTMPLLVYHIFST
jgi:hypothetical protein